MQTSESERRLSLDSLDEPELSDEESYWESTRQAGPSNSFSISHARSSGVQGKDSPNEALHWATQVESDWDQGDSSWSLDVLSVSTRERAGGPATQ